tara:strand:+ start:229 stop:768 length:540 start_codon:yes stop_codon:yes gene_type:complete
MEDTEDKRYWVQKGREEEEIFCRTVAPLYGLDVMINPAKVENPYDHDLMVLKEGKYHPAELKSVKTPFYKASEIAGIPPNRCVTFNHKDYIRYMSKYFYRKLYIFFWVSWEESERGKIKVDKLEGLWIGSIHHIDNLITSRRTGFHKYTKRANLSDGNAKASHMLSLDDLHKFKSYKLN